MIHQTFLMKDKDGIFYELNVTSEQQMLKQIEMEAKQTAVEYLAERMIRMIPTNSIVYEADVLMYIEQAKQMEKEQIIDAFNGEPHCDGDGDRYYNETFKKS